jgi:GT2 family glycosyltransferase/glycosyltransferase involved in cell wall biosynthesis
MPGHARLRSVPERLQKEGKLPSLRDFVPKFYRGGPIRFYLPLLYDLVAIHQPELIVSIGFDEGEAHFTFCQAAQEQELKCRCLVIHRDDSGKQKEDGAWQKGKAYGEEFYGATAQFLSGSPMQLAEDFAKQNVDLLLISDCDSGSTIRQELAAWKTRLAPDAIVLVHGTELKREDAPKDAWSEFTSRKPHMELSDGMGLGLAAITSSSKSTHFFSRLGESLEWYRLAADKIDAQARVAQIVRENTALEMRQIWLDSVLADRWKAQQIMDHQVRALAEVEGQFEPLLRDREKAQEVMDSQAEALEALRRDRTKAQLVMDAQGEQLRQLGMTAVELSSQVRKLKAQTAEQKRILKIAKDACRKKGRCFEEPKERRPIAERIMREVARSRRNLCKLWAPKTPVTPEKKTEALILNPGAQYQRWMANHEPDSTGLDRQRQALRSWTNLPRISLLVPVFNSSAQFLEEMLASVAAQTYQNWEISLVNASSRDQQSRDVLNRWAEREPRLRVQHLERNLGISENTNCALEHATGDFVALLDQDDLLAPFALFELAQALRANPQVDLFYSDEDRWSETGERTAPFFKPEWSPELLYSCMYLGHLSAYRRSLVIGLGGFRKKFDLSQDYDLALRATERTQAIYHIPHILYHWREHRQSGSLGGKPEARKTNLAALADAMHRRNLPADVLEYPTANRVRMKVTRWPRVSVIVPTDSPVRLQHCLNNLPRSTSYPNWEIVIVTNSSLANSLGHTQTADPSFRIVNYDQPFNFSAKSNLGAKAASGERLIFFNDDVEATQPDWIQNLIEPLENPEVGAVAPKMLYPTNKIQHAGLVTGVRGLVGTAFHQQLADTTMHANFAQSMRNVSALSGACLAMRREDFLREGGFDEVNTPISHSDVDLCFKIRDRGMRCVYTPFVTMTHVGHVSIDDKERREETPPSSDKSSLYLLRRWGEYTAHDPYYPDNMRNWLFADSPTPIQISGRNRCGPLVESRDVLFVSHDLSLSGAPILLLHLVNWCKANGIFPVLIAPEGGALREKFEAADITTIIDPLVATGHESFRKLLRDFDCVVTNTIKTWPAVRAAHREGVPVLWWLHETLVGDHFLQRDANLRASLPLADFILTPTKRTSAVYLPFTDRPVKHLRYGVPDAAAATQSAPPKNDRVQFLLLGSMEPRKGQDILVEAVQQLSPELQNRAVFKIVGRMMVPEFAAKVNTAAKGLGNFSIENETSHAEALELIRRSDVLVCASRDEAMPVTIIEAMCLSKAVVSTRVGGISEILKDNKDGLLVSAENVLELSAALARLITAPELIAELGRNARITYEENFMLDRFGRDFKVMLEEVITNQSRSVAKTNVTDEFLPGAVTEEVE